MSVGAVALAFVAGVLTSLSPCVLPILPLVLGAAASERKYGPVALAAGLAISFVVVGLFVATIGYSIGLTTELFRQVAAALMVMLGAVLIFPPLQSRLALASGPMANWTDRHLGSERGSGYAKSVLGRSPVGGHRRIFPKEHAKRRRGTRRGDFAGA